MSCPGAAGRGGSGSRSERSTPTRRFPRSSRLTARRQFQRVHEKGQRIRSVSFTLLGVRNEVGGCRLGITVSRRLGGAVLRNRVKRVLREVFRYNRCALAPALDLVVLARPGIEERTVAELETEFLRRFNELVRRLER